MLCQDKPGSQTPPPPSAANSNYKREKAIKDVGDNIPERMK
jgi:hypothetical protein